MKSGEWKTLNPDEMKKRVEDLKKELFNLRHQLRMGQLENNNRIKTVKREIARGLTIIAEMQKV